MKKLAILALLLFPAMVLADVFVNVGVKVNDKKTNVQVPPNVHLAGLILVKANGKLKLEDGEFWLHTRKEVVRVKPNWVTNAKKLKSLNEQDVVIQGFLSLVSSETPYLSISPMDAELR